MEKKFECDSKTGLHIVKQRESGCAAFFTKPTPLASSASSVILKPLVGLTLGIPIGFGIYKWGDTEMFDTRLEVAKTYDLQWAFLGSIVFSLMTVFINLYPMLHKAKVMKGGNMRAN